MTESFVCSYLNYCPLVCHFCKTKSLQKIENITKRVLTYFHHDFESDYSEPPQKLNKATMTTPPPDTGNKLNIHKMFKRHHGHLLNILSTFNFCIVSRMSVLNHWCYQSHQFAENQLRSNEQSDFFFFCKKVWINTLLFRGSTSENRTYFCFCKYSVLFCPK